MSAPKTNVEKQERRHAGPLIGIAACIVFAIVIFTVFFAFQTDDVEDGAEPIVSGETSATGTEAETGEGDAAVETE